MNTHSHLMNISSVWWTRRPGQLLVALALILMVANAASRLASGPVANSTEPMREKVDHPSTQEGPLLDHSVVNRKGILAEPDPSSPMSPAYYHV